MASGVMSPLAISFGAGRGVAASISAETSLAFSVSSFRCSFVFALAAVFFRYSSCAVNIWRSTIAASIAG